MVMEFLQTLAYVVGAIVGNALFVQYAFWSPWRSTRMGWVLFSMFGLFALGYDLAALALLWPETFAVESVLGWTRVGFRLGIDVVLIGLYVLTVNAQRAGRRAQHPPASPADIPRDQEHDDAR